MVVVSEIPVVSPTTTSRPALIEVAHAYGLDGKIPHAQYPAVDIAFEADRPIVPAVLIRREFVVNPSEFVINPTRDRHYEWFWEEIIKTTSLPILNVLITIVLVFAKIRTHLIPADWDILNEFGQELRDDFDFKSLFFLLVPFCGDTLHLRSKEKYKQARQRQPSEFMPMGEASQNLSSSSV